MARRFQSIQSRFLWRVVPLMICMTVFQCLISGWYTYERVIDEVNRKSRKSAIIYSELLSESLWNLDNVGVELVLGTVIDDPDVSEVRVFDEKQELFASKVRKQDEPVQKFTSVYHPIIHMSNLEIRQIGSLEIDFQSNRLWQTIIEQTAFITLTMSLLVGLILISVVLACQNLIGRPLAEFRESIRRAKDQKTISHVPISAPDEIGEVITSYNGLQKKLSAEKESLRQAVEMAMTANRSKSEFLANMSHELRTPLNGIIGFAEIMERETFGQLGSAKYEEYVRDIETSGRHLLSLINDILDMSKIESGHFEIYEQLNNLNDIVISCRRMIAPKAREKSIELSTHIAPTTLGLFGDSRSIKQIILNLLSNSVKFTPEGGIVVIEILLTEDRQVSMKVSDTGIGISPENLKKVTEPFHQGESAFQRRYQGTGLGLAITQKLVEAHGANMEIVSTQGAGTTITVLFPPERTWLDDDESNGTDLPLEQAKLSAAGNDI